MTREESNVQFTVEVFLTETRNELSDYCQNAARGKVTANANPRVIARAKARFANRYPTLDRALTLYLCDESTRRFVRSAAMPKS